jgi:hypothetical protein
MAFANNAICAGRENLIWEGFTTVLGSRDGIHQSWSEMLVE